MKTANGIIAIVGLVIFGFMASCTHRGPDIVGTGSGTESALVYGITGMAVDTTGKAVEGASVLLRPRKEPIITDTCNTARFDSVLTDSNGIFLFRNTLPGQYNIEIHDQQHQAILVQCVQPITDTLVNLGQNILRPTGVLRGRVQFQGIPSTYYANLYLREIYNHMIALDSGKFEIPLAAGNYSLQVVPLSHNYIVVDTFDIKVKPGDTTDIIIYVPLLNASNLDSNYIKDTIAVRAILDSNNISYPVKFFTWVKDGRITAFRCDFHWWTSSETADSVDLFVIPDEIGELSMLSSIEINGNNYYEYSTIYNKYHNYNDPNDTLTTMRISQKVSQLKSLISLKIKYKKLKVIPTLTGSKYLERLELIGCRIETVPDFIFDLSNLNVLNLQKNVIPMISSGIGKLQNLTYLDSSETYLSQMPYEISELAKLTYLDLSFNRLTNILGIEKLANLEELNIGANQITALPDAINKLSSLHYLFVGGNQLTQLPGGITQWSCYIDVMGNMLCDIPPETMTWITAHQVYTGSNCYRCTDTTSYWMKYQTCN